MADYRPLYYACRFWQDFAGTMVAADRHARFESAGSGTSARGRALSAMAMIAAAHTPNPTTFKQSVQLDSIFGDMPPMLPARVG